MSIVKTMRLTQFRNHIFISCTKTKVLISVVALRHFKLANYIIATINKNVKR